MQPTHQPEILKKSIKSVQSPLKVWLQTAQRIAEQRYKTLFQYTRKKNQGKYFN